MLIEIKNIESFRIEDGKLTIKAREKYSVYHKIYIEIKNLTIETTEKTE